MNNETHIIKHERSAGFAPLGGSGAVELAMQLKRGMVLDRPNTNKLLRLLENLESEVIGCAVMQAQLRAILAQKDWVKIGITADPSTIRTTGVNIGVVEAKYVKTKTRQSPMQKWQRNHGLNRR